MRYVCHQCLRIIQFEEIAHVDMYADVCWLQCDACEQAYGKVCGVDRRYNPRPHGYFSCPFRQALVQSPAPRLHVMPSPFEGPSGDELR
jgi:hypothetical protein